MRKLALASVILIAFFVCGAYATINSAANKVIALGNGSTTQFTFSFIGDQAGYISVIYTDASGNETTLTQGTGPTQYQITLNPAVSPGLWGIGGTVTYDPSSTPIAVGTTLTIVRTLPFVQNISLLNLASLAALAQSTERGLDQLEMQIQQLAENLNRVVAGPVSDPSGINYTLPAAAQRANNVLCFDGLGNVAACSTLPSGTVSSAMQPVVSATSLGAGRTALGLGNTSTTNIGCNLASVSGASNLDVNFATSQISTSGSITSANCGQNIVAGATLTLTLARANTLWNGFGFTVNVLAGSGVTLTPNSNDALPGQASGTSITLAPGATYSLVTNGASSGAWYVKASIPTSFNAASGVQQYYSIGSDTYFGSGRPWVDVRSGANGCVAAVGNGANDYAAFNCQATYLANTFGGGILFAPCGTYQFHGSTLTLTDGIVLVGAGRICTVVENAAFDATVVSFPNSPGGNDFNGFRDLTILGYQNAAATKDAVFIGNNSATFLTNATIWGGRYGLQNCGTDGTVADVYATGYTGGLLSCGANWYIRDKFDGPLGPGVGGTFAMQQITPYAGLNVAENHFIQCDFSGSWTDSIFVSDTTGKTIDQFSESVFSSPIGLTSGQFSFVNNELSNNVFDIGTNAIVVVSGNLVVAGSLTISNGGVLKCSANYNITNAGC